MVRFLVELIIVVGIFCFVFYCPEILFRAYWARGYKRLIQAQGRILSEFCFTCPVCEEYYEADEIEAIVSEWHQHVSESCGYDDDVEETLYR